jgi:simple sugar transport system permease protein
MNFDFRQKPIELKTAVIAVIFGIVIGGILMLVSKHDPFKIYAVLFNGAFGDKFALASSLRWTIPLLFTGVASAIAFRGGMFNIGVEGQMYLGALAGALTGIYLTGLSSWVHIPLIILASALAGMAWAFVPALLKVRYNASEVVTTLMLNYVAIYLTDYLVKYYFIAKGSYGQTIITDQIQKSARMPSLIHATQLHAGLLIGILFVVLFYFLIKKSKLGYEISISGINPEFARYGGVSVNRVRMSVMLISGAVAGVGGAVEVMGITWRFMSHFSPNFGFDGILASLLGGNTPIGVLLGALFMGSLKAGALTVERSTDVSRSLATIIQGVIICFVSARYLMARFPVSKWLDGFKRNNRRRNSDEPH